MKYRGVLILIIGLLALIAGAQKASRPMYPDGSRVCFVGNSITNNGEFYNNLWLYYATRFPKDKITIYNCGISGDVAGGVLKRMDKDILSHKPTHAVLMIGMNDVNRDLYGKNNGADSLKQAALATYRKNTDRIVKLLEEKTGHVILLKPSIYDQTAAIPTENLYGVNGALQRCAMQMETLSRKYKTGIVDFQTIMLDINARKQQEDSMFTIVGNDRVHPLSPGHFVMAYQFLKDTKAPRYVSRIIVEKNLISSNKSSFNCGLKNWIRTNKLISFECLENSLPFPVKEPAEKALEWIPFNEDFNSEVLQVINLTPGSYDISIDGEFILNCSDSTLRKGINLALFKTTPQYKQSLNVLAACVEYRNTESIIRNLRFVEFNHLAGLDTLADPDATRVFLDQRLETLRNGGHYEYHQKQFNNYILQKRHESETLQKLSAIAEKIYSSNQPKVHVFKIEKSG